MQTTNNTPEIEPFTSEDLVLFVQSDREFFDAMDNIANLIRTRMRMAAKHLANCHADWHDDPEDAEEHAQHHAPYDVQFPQAVRDAAALELIELHLTAMRENDEYQQAQEDKQ